MKRNKSKTLDLILIGIVILFIAGSFFIATKIISSSSDKSPKEDLDLSVFRSANIPEECRIPEYENRIESWKEHLSHHQQTLYCLEYYK